MRKAARLRRKRASRCSRSSSSTEWPTMPTRTATSAAPSRRSSSGSRRWTAAGRAPYRDVDAGQRCRAATSRRTRPRAAWRADADAYDLIMRDKERLLSLDEPVAFIFSHSALREGWDNPNVFQICTLNQTVSTMQKRQEIGRGMRLAVNQDGRARLRRAGQPPHRGGQRELPRVRATGCRRSTWRSSASGQAPPQPKHARKRAHGAPEEGRVSSSIAAVQGAVGSTSPGARATGWSWTREALIEALRPGGRAHRRRAGQDPHGARCASTASASAGVLETTLLGQGRSRWSATTRCPT